jgi:cyanate lyase
MKGHEITEQIGDGIVSAIRFSVDLRKKPHPSGGRKIPSPAMGFAR